MMEDRLGSRYVHLDATWPRDAGLGIDVATPEAAEILIALGRDTVAQADPEKLALFL
jgi:hypothetical protein